MSGLKRILVIQRGFQDYSVRNDHFAWEYPGSDWGKKPIMKRNTKRNRGFTLVEIMIVVLIIGILAAIAVPNFVKARESARRATCIGNLTQINSAKEQWAMDQRKSSGDAVTNADITPAYIKSFPVCPAGGAYTTAVVGTNPSCSKAAAPDLHVLP